MRRYTASPVVRPKGRCQTIGAGVKYCAWATFRCSNCGGCRMDQLVSTSALFGGGHHSLPRGGAACRPALGAGVGVRPGEPPLPVLLLPRGSDAAPEAPLCLPHPGKRRNLPAQRSNKLRARSLGLTFRSWPSSCAASPSVRPHAQCRPAFFPNTILALKSRRKG